MRERQKMESERQNAERAGWEEETRVLKGPRGRSESRRNQITRKVDFNRGVLRHWGRIHQSLETARRWMDGWKAEDCCSTILNPTEGLC